jgi:tRNA(Ile)-lysidine synthase
MTEDLNAGHPELDLHAAECGVAPRIIIAVSGGGDSMALLALYVEKRSFEPDLPEPVAISIDHGLRAGFAAEADIAAAYSARLGITHETLVWQGEKPQTGLMAAARVARYGLLADAAKAHGADCVLVAHTLDDQAETMAMRRALRAF